MRELSLYVDTQKMVTGKKSVSGATFRMLGSSKTNVDKLDTIVGEMVERGGGRKQIDMIIDKLGGHLPPYFGALIHKIIKRLFIYN